MKKVMIIFGAILFAATILTSCNSKEETTNEQEIKSVQCGYCKAKLYDGQPAVGSLTAPGKYFCNNTCSDMYKVYGSK